MAAIRALAITIAAVASVQLATAQSAAERREALSRMIPKHEGYLGALAPENLDKERPAPPFDLTGTWFVDLSRAFGDFRFGPPYPEFIGQAKLDFEEGQRAAAERRPYRDAIGQCFPAGQPMVMTRVWPIAMIQLPTAIYMISEFMNSLRVIYLDGRTHTDPDIVVRTFNGESIGRWEGDTLVVDTRNFTDLDKHWVDQGIPASKDFRMIERYRLINNGNVLEGQWTLIDPQNWEGEWKGTRRWNRVTDHDIQEVECLPDLNEHLQSTSSSVHVN